MLKISDFSKLARVPTATLRYYDVLGLLKPAQVDKFTEYRYYTLDQLPRLNRILALKDLGFSLEDIARLLNGHIPTTVTGVEIMNLNIVAGLMLIALPILFNAAFFALQRRFEYPDILRRPTGYILQRFAAGGRWLIGTWYAFMLSAVLFVPAAIVLGQTTLATSSPLMTVAVPLGIIAGLLQFLGLARWPFLVPPLAKAYADPAITPSARDAIDVVFQAFNHYAGVAIGEHLGYFFTGAWTLLIGLAVWSASPWLAVVGLVAAIGIWTGLLENAGFKPAGAINAMSYIIWSLWLIALGIALILR